METIRRWEEGDSDRGTISDRVSRLENQITFKEAKEITEQEKKPFPWKGKFRTVMKRDPKRIKEKIIVICLNAKKEIEEPVILPVISGGLIVYRDKGFAFDPTCLYTIKMGSRINKVLFLEEIDRLPIGHRYRQVKTKDIEELKKQGRYTFNDSILLKMLWNAQIEKKPTSPVSGKVIFWIVLAAIAGIIIYMFTK